MNRQERKSRTRAIWKIQVLCSVIHFVIFTISFLKGRISPEEFSDWGWRITYMIHGILSGVLLFYSSQDKMYSVMNECMEYWVSNRVFDRNGQNQVLSVFKHLLLNMYCALLVSMSFNVLIWHSMSGFPPELQHFDLFFTGVVTVSFLLPTVMCTYNYYKYCLLCKNISETARRI